MRREDDSAPGHLKLHEEYLRLYKIAHNNAGVLLSEAEILLERGKYIRAFFLGLTALEEIAKSQLAADVFTGVSSEKEFQDHYCSHPKKIGRMAWATEEAQHYLNMWGDQDLELKHPTATSRTDALYVSLEGKKIQRPEDVVTESDAKGIVQTVESALEAIARNEIMGYQIGTKGFM
jgi:AbiV family abortive infection protein